MPETKLCGFAQASSHQMDVCRMGYDNGHEARGQKNIPGSSSGLVPVCARKHELALRGGDLFALVSQLVGEVPDGDLILHALVVKSALLLVQGPVNGLLCVELSSRSCRFRQSTLYLSMEQATCKISSDQMKPEGIDFQASQESAIERELVNWDVK